MTEATARLALLTLPLAICVSCAHVSGGPSGAPAQPRSDAGAPSHAQALAWDRLNASQGGNLWIQWDPDTRSPRRIRNEAPRPLAPAAPRDLVAHAERLLADNGELFGFRPGVDELRRIGTSEENGLTWVGFVQSYRGVPVRDRGYGVWLRPDGRLHMLEGAFSQGIDIEGVPAVDEAEAIGIATDPADRGRVRSATLVIETSRGARLVWEIDTSFEWVVVDARSGVVVSRRLIIY